MDSWSKSSTQPVSRQEKRLVLLGSHTDAKVSCGNTILRQDIFSSLQMFDRHAGTVSNRRLMVINTPDLRDLALYSGDQEMRRCFQLSYPGPHVLLLVLKSGTFTDQERDSLEHINTIFGEGALEFVIVVFMHDEKLEYVSVTESTDAEETAVESLLQICKWPQLHLKSKGDQLQVQNLLESIDKMVEKNGGHYLKIPEEEESRPAGENHTVYPTTAKQSLGIRTYTEGHVPRVSKEKLICDQSTISRFKSNSIRKLQRSNSTAGTEKRSDGVRIVLTGKTGVGKSAAGNTILGRDVFESRARMASVTKKCQRESGEICGRAVTVVDTPGLFDATLSNDEIQQEIMRCIELSAPGPHVFLLVIAVGRFTQEEKETLRLIQMTFGQKADSYSIVLFTWGDCLGDESIEDYVKEGDSDVKKLIDDCGGRYHMFKNNHKDPAQVVSLLKKIDKMLWKNDGSFYNNNMFQEAERALRLIQLNKEKEVEVRQEMEVIKAKYEAEMKEMKDKLEKEKAKGKLRELLLLEKENILWRNIRAGRYRDDEVTADPEQIQDQLDTEASSEIKGSADEEPLTKQKQPSEETDLDSERKSETTRGQTGGESDQHKKKHKMWGGFGALKRKEKRKQREKNEKKTKEYDAEETAGGKEKMEEIEDTITDQKVKKDSDSFRHERPLMNPEDPTDTKQEQDNIDEPKDTNNIKLLHQQYKDMEECRKKMEDIKRRYKDIEDIHAAELKKMKKRHADNIAAWERKHGKCFLQ